MTSVLLMYLTTIMTRVVLSCRLGRMSLVLCILVLRKLGPPRYLDLESNLKSVSKYRGKGTSNGCLTTVCAWCEFRYCCPSVGVLFLFVYVKDSTHFDVFQKNASWCTLCNLFLHYMLFLCSITYWYCRCCTIHGQWLPLHDSTIL